jgi:ribonucleotide reductase alpha subunit
MFIFPKLPQAHIKYQTTKGFTKPDNGVPDWMTAEGYYMLKSGYLLDGESPWDAYVRLAEASARSLKRPELAQKFFKIMWLGWLGPASPVLANLGTTRGFPISCNSTHVQDSLGGIFHSVTELAHLSSKGAGVGIYMGDIRGRGASISGGYISEGVIPWCKIIDSTTVGVSQNGVRKGASAAYLPFSHPDIKEFINMRRPTGDENQRCMNIHHAVCLTDEDMEAISAGGEARELFGQILRARIETGEPYLFFTDNVNRTNPLGYERLGLKVKTSNICLKGEELVRTKDGAVPIKDLVGKTVSIWDGKDWVSNSSFEQKGIYDRFIRIIYNDDTSIDVTPEHRVPVQEFGVVGTQKTKFITARELYDHYARPNSALLEVLTHKNKATGLIKQVTRVYLEEPVPVYCTSVPTTKMFALADGRMTGNCSEITAYTDPSHTFVCCLSSMNLAKWEEWRETDAVYWATWFLDGVMQEYIDKIQGEPFFDNAYRFAVKSRMLGLGAMGWHSLLQERKLPFESFGASLLNRAVFRHLADESHKASVDMAKEYGEPEWCQGTGVHNTHTITCAPTVTNSIICGHVSAGIEPFAANSFEKKTSRGSMFFHNPTLQKVLAEYGRDDEETWDSITEARGSVQHLNFLSELEREVFLTAREINQMAIIKQAAERQIEMDRHRQGQSQSVNLFFTAEPDPTYFAKVHYEAWRLGLKTLYYCRSQAIQNAEGRSGQLAAKRQQELERKVVTQSYHSEDGGGECLACQG